MTLLIPYQHLEWMYYRLKSGVNPTLETIPKTETKAYSQNGSTNEKEYKIQKMFNPNTL